MKLLFSGMRAKPCLQATAARLRCDILFTILTALLLSFLGAIGQPKGVGSPSLEGSLALAPLSVGDTLPPITVQISLPEKGRVSIPQAGKLPYYIYGKPAAVVAGVNFPFLIR